MQSRTLVAEYLQKAEERREAGGGGGHVNAISTQHPWSKQVRDLTLRARIVSDNTRVYIPHYQCLMI